MISDDLAENCPELPSNENHRVFKWTDGHSVVYFSGSKQGKAFSIHIAAKGRNKSKLREAVNEFCETIFALYPWCVVIVGAIKKSSVINLAKKCGFEYLAKAEIHTGDIVPVYARYRG